MKKILAATMVAAMLITGAAVASAQEAPDDAPATEAVTTVADVIQGLVDDGTLTQEQADAVNQALEQHRANRPGKQGRGGPGLDTVAEALGTTVDDLRSQLADGSTLADIAGDDVDVVAEVLSDEMNSRIDQALEDGKIDEDRAAELRDGIAEKVDSILNGELPRRGPHGHHGPRGGGFGPGADAPEAETSA